MSEVTIVPLPREVVAEDHRLEKAASGSSAALMKHRWHWTLDESNAKRVPISQYARDVGMNEATIRVYATGYVHLTGSGSTSRTPGEALDRATMTGETYAAVKAVARARGVVPRTASDRYMDEVRQVRQLARERAEENETTVEEETKKAADWIVKAEKARELQRQQHGFQWSKTEGKLQDAKRKIVEAIEVAMGAEFDREERDLLLHTVGEVQDGLLLVRQAVSGKTIADKKLELLRGGLSA